MKLHNIVAKLVLSLSSGLLAMPVVAADETIDPMWKSIKTSIDFIDPIQRLIVVGDREFEVPFNTMIFNASDDPIALSSLKQGNRIWLHLDAKKAHIKRIEKRK